MTGQSNLATPNNEGSLSLFSIPRELRDQVYHELWMMEPLIPFNYNGIVMEARYSPCDGQNTRTGLPTWLLANKSTLKEGLEQLHRKGSKCVWSLTHEKKYGGRSLPQLMPSAFQELVIDIGFLTTCSLGTGRQFDTSRWDHILTGLATAYHGLDSKLLILRVFCSLVHTTVYNPNDPCEVDLSELRHFPRSIEKLVIGVSVPKLIERGKSEFARVLEHEVVRVGTLVVGGKVKQSTAVDSEFPIKLPQRFKQKHWLFEFDKDEH